MSVWVPIAGPGPVDRSTEIWDCSLGIGGSFLMRPNLLALYLTASQTKSLHHHGRHSVSFHAVVSALRSYSL